MGTQLSSMFWVGDVALPLWSALASGASILLLYAYLTWPYDVFKRMGLMGPRPVPLFGTTLSIFKRSVAEIDVENAKLYGKVYGEFNGRVPLLFVGEPDMVKEVLIKEFSSFANRTQFKSLQQKPLDRMLTVARDEHWKHTRAALSPLYTSGKLKEMLPMISQCAENLMAYIDKQAEEAINTKDILSGYTMDVISATAFGLDTRALEQPDHMFLKHAKDFFSFIGPGNRKKMVALAIAVVSHRLSLALRKFGLTTIDPVAEAYMESVIRSALTGSDGHSGRQNLVRLCHDQLVDIKQVSSTSIRKTPDGLVWTTQGLTMDDIVSNSMVFLLAGYDTVSTFITFFCYAMATNEIVQRKVYEEILENVGQREIDYEVLKNLHYLDLCMDETLRMYPSSLRLDRTCNKATKIGGFHIPEGMSVIIPVYAIHHDPAYWEEPYRFKPERNLHISSGQLALSDVSSVDARSHHCYRFSAAEKAKIQPCTYLPFGAGPRTCIGMRLALLEAKVVVVKLLSKYEICGCKHTPEPPVKLTKSFGLLVPANPIFLSFKRRQAAS